MIEFKDDREMYLVAPALAPEMVGEFSPSTLYTAINRQGVLFLWPVKIPTADSAAAARGIDPPKPLPIMP